MSTYCGSLGNNNSFSKFFGILILLAALGSMVVLGTHALKHSGADNVRNCDSKNIGLKLKNPTTGRIAILCLYDVENKQWGRMICENDSACGDQMKEVTSFTDSESRKNYIAYVLRNLKNAGYEVVTDISESVGLRIGVNLNEVIAQIFISAP